MGCYYHLSLVKLRGGSRGGPPNLIRRERTLRVCTRISHVLVVNSYPDSSLSEILGLYLPLKLDQNDRKLLLVPSVPWWVGSVPTGVVDLLAPILTVTEGQCGLATTVLRGIFFYYFYFLNHHRGNLPIFLTKFCV